MDKFLQEIQDVFSSCEDLFINIEIKEIKISHRFKDDLGIDSLGLMTFTYDLQEKFPSLDEMSMSDWITIEDCINSLKDLKE